MTQKCSVCTHPSRQEIDNALASGVSCPKISARYGTIDRPLGRMSLQRHKVGHLSEALVEAIKEQHMNEAIDIVKQLRVINDASISILKKARSAGDHDMALKAVDRLHRQIELQAKLLGDLNDGTTVSVLVSPEWVALRTAIMDALNDYPSARIAVTERLMLIEGKGR